MSMSNLITMPIKLPQPTLNEPFAQINYIFERVAGTKSSSRRKKILSGLKWYKTFISGTANYDESLVADPRFYLNKHWDEFALVKFEAFLSESNTPSNPNYITSATVNGLIYSIKQVMEYAIHKKLTASDHLFPVAVPEPVRETTTHEAYTDQEYDQITSAIQNELTQVLKVIDQEPYVKTGKGRDPREKPPRRNGMSYPEGWGWKFIDNLRWYFENEMNCIPMFATKANLEKHPRFFSAVAQHYSHIGGLKGIYASFGIVPFIKADLIMPLLIKLVAETGMNPDSVLNLSVDCYEDEHPLSGVPYLKYYKERSTGEKELHLSLYDKNTEIKELKIEEARIIKRTIERIKQITRNIRAEAPPQLQKKLFLHKLHGNRDQGRIKVLDNGVTSDWCKRMVEKYNLTSSDGRPLNFNLVRFRPTRITNLVRRGYDFFEIMSQAGHASITTTLRYLSKRNLELAARREILNALETIHQNQVWAKENKPAYSGSEESGPPSNCSNIYKGIVADCRNPFDPPEQVKNSPQYEPNKACTRPIHFFTKIHSVLLKRYSIQLRVSLTLQILRQLLNRPYTWMYLLIR
ncbi:site-specific integrase [Paenibacillus sp. TAB 01]|uniref:site-specific integrase n=1 Tax=Paenibacillus sp. TAB 01 TaxID=3368988 RepID=UPI003751F44D